jgi:hypothetical protein
MRRVLLTTIGLGAVGAATSAGANTLDIGYSTSVGGAPSTIATGSEGVLYSTSAPLNQPALGSFLSNTIQGTDDFPLDLAGTTTDAANGGAKFLYLYISETGITYDASKLTFTIGVGEGSLPKGWSVTESVFSDSSNTAYGKGLLLASDTFSGTTPGSTLDTVTSLVPFGKPFSVTEEIAITLTSASARGQDQSTVSVTATIPEASTWAMMTLGFAGLGYAAFRRSAKTRPPGEVV